MTSLTGYKAPRFVRRDALIRVNMERTIEESAEELQQLVFESSADCPDLELFNKFKGNSSYNMDSDGDNDDSDGGESGKILPNPALIKKRKLSAKRRTINESANKIWKKFIAESFFLAIPAPDKQKRNYYETLTSEAMDILEECSLDNLSHFGREVADEIDMIKENFADLCTDYFDSNDLSFLNSTKLPALMKEAVEEVKQRLIVAQLNAKSNSEYRATRYRLIEEACREGGEEMANFQKNKLNKKIKPSVMEKMYMQARCEDKDKTAKQCMTEAVINYAFLETLNVLGLIPSNSVENI